jgi:hypothetical protein
MSNLARSALVATLSLVVAACSSGGATSSSGPPSSPPSAAPSPTAGGFGEIEHATGATDVILRYEEGGGFMMAGFTATQAPIFTLYGDGTVIFRNLATDFLEPVGSIYPNPPFRTAKLTEEQIQSTLALALGDGGLGVARANYENNMISDASTAIFTVDAGGIKKTVSIYALGLEGDGVPDAVSRKAFKGLADRLADFDKGGAIATDVYKPAGYRGVLLEGAAAPDQKPWPWEDITPADFPFPADPNEFQMAQRVLTPADVEKLGVETPEGGFMGMILVGPDDKLYSLSLRPLLPDEKA